MALQNRIKALNREADRTFELPLCPIGYEDNNGRVSTQVLIGGGYYADTKWIQQCDDGCVNLLVGKDFDEEPYSTDLYLNPSYSNKVAELLLCWFNNILTGPPPAFHTLHKAVSDLDNWNMVAEIEHYHCYNDHRCCITFKLDQITTKLALIEDSIHASRHQLEAACLPSLIPNLEGQAFPHAQHG